MTQEDDLIREINILRRNVKDLQAQLNQAHQRIKHLSQKTGWSPDQMELKLDGR